jgi:uncharacterized protein (DUF983 family)
MADTERLPIWTGLSCRCPRCGKGKLFQGFLSLRPRCDACGLEYDFADAGDGPAVFIILLAGFVVVACALIVAVTLLPLRPMKGLMIALQYHHKAAEGRPE